MFFSLPPQKTFLDVPRSICLLRVLRYLLSIHTLLDWKVRYLHFFFEMYIKCIIILILLWQWLLFFAINNFLVDATGDLDRVRQIRSMVGDKLLLYSGNDDTAPNFGKYVWFIFMCKARIYMHSSPLTHCCCPVYSHDRRRRMHVSFRSMKRL